MASKLRNVFNKKSEEDLAINNNSYNLTEIVRYGFPFMPMCMCYDPLQSLLAIGTKTGCVRILGRPGVDVLLQHNDDVAIVDLQFIINTGQLVTATTDDHIHLWSLKEKQPRIVHSLRFQRDRITYLHLPFQSTWIYVGTDKGNVYMVNVMTFELSGYLIMWNKTMDIYQKHHPGHVTQIAENPVDQNKMLIGYNTGLIVLWDLSKKSAEFHYKTSDVKQVSWHHGGKMFMSCHGDGSLSVWNVKSPQAPEKSWVPHLKENNGKCEPCQPITKVEWKSSKSSDSIIIFTGGLGMDKCSTPSLTLTSGEKVTTFTLDSPVIDFISISTTPYRNVVQDPVAVVVLMRDEFIVVDLLSHNLIPFEPAYPFDIHQSKVTCCHYLTNCSTDITPMLYSVTSKQKRRQYSDKEWPIKGGEWGSPVFSYSEIIITGHEDGSVKFWDATGVTLLMLYKIKTSRLFEPGSANSSMGGATPTHAKTPPTFHLKSVNQNPYAIHHISFCDQSKLLCVAGSYHAVLYKFTKNETSSECPVIDIHMIYQNFDSQPMSTSGHSFEFSSPQEERMEMDGLVQVKSGVAHWPAGYKPEFCCSLAWNNGRQPTPIVSLVLNSKYGLLAIGNDTGLAVVDILTKTCLFAFASPDLYGSSDPFSRHPPPLAVNSDQSDEKKSHTPISSTSTENPKNFLNLSKPNEANGHPQTPVTPETPSSPFPPHVGDGSTPVPPPRKKKQGTPTVQRSERVQGSQESKSNVLSDNEKPPADASVSPGNPDGLAVVETGDKRDEEAVKQDVADVNKVNDSNKIAIDDSKNDKNDSDNTEEEEEEEEEEGVKGDILPVQQQNLNSCSCIAALNRGKPGENNLGRICCCLRDTSLSPELSTEETKLIPDPSVSSPSIVPDPPVQSQNLIADDMKMSANKVENSEETQPLSQVVPSSRQNSLTNSSAVHPLIASKQSVPSWKLKFNRLLNSVSALMSSSAGKNEPIMKKLRFEVIDMSNDIPAVTKETNYDSYARQCRKEMSGEGSTSDEDNFKESILDVFFANSFPHKNEAVQVPCLWVGTSLGSILVLSFEGCPNPLVAPTGTILRLKGPIINITILNSDCSQIIESPTISWKDFGREARDCFERKTVEGISTADHMQHILLTSDRQIRLIGLPSMTCIQKFKVTDGNYVVKAKAVFIKESLCLLTRHVNGNIVLFDLPNLKVIQEFKYLTGTHKRLSATFQFSNFGHGMVMTFPSEIQKFVVNKGIDDQLSDQCRQLYTPCETPEAPKVGFFQSLFDSHQQQAKLDREALFGETGSGKPSKTLTKYVARLEQQESNAVAATSEIARAKMAALERGERLGELEERTAMMKINAENYSNLASQVKNKYKNKKWYQF